MEENKKEIISKEENTKSLKLEKIKFNILAIFAIVILSTALTPVTFQNDTYYTIAIGKHIAETGTIDMQDPFSWHENLPYTYPHWLYDLGTYGIYQLGENIGIGGFTAIYITTIILSCILVIVIYLACLKISNHHIVSFLITMGIMYLLKAFITARAQLVTFILFALTILFIEQFLKDNHCELNPELELAGNHLVTLFTKMGFGVGYATKEFIQDELDKKILFPLNLKEKIPSRFIGIATSKNHVPSFSTKKLLELMGIKSD